MVDLLLQRKILTTASTIGDLDIAGEFTVHTLEDTIRDPGVKVEHETAIPQGRYRVIVDYSYRFKRYMFHILDVPMFEGIRIHCGNDAADTDGCVLVGVSEGANWIGGSHVAFDKVWKRLTIEDGYDEVHLCPRFRMREETWITVENVGTTAAAA